MNIYDIAKAAGVSIATVSRVLNGSGKVSPATREKILAIIQENNYTPNAFARGLGMGSMRTVGILCANTSDLYLSEAVFHLESKLRKSGFNSLLCCTGYDKSEKENALRLMLSKSVDAVILVGSNYIESEDSANDYIRRAARQVPVFMMNGAVKGENIYCVTCDDYSVSFELADMLLSTGSKTILFAQRNNSYSTRRMIAGIKDACAKHNAPFTDDHIANCEAGVGGVISALRGASRKVRFDTVMCFNDLLAASALKYAQQEGLDVPSQLRITGYDYSMLSLITTPLLTTVDNKVELMSHTTVDVLVHCLAKDLPVSQQTVISAAIVKGQST
ncbi:MAG: LacI family DNA-binding transcriptional regulator [Clostridia bacterium]|nr:LacI family DNA-binding transcriptional regulator [Clostridia bacterium]MBR4955769.1 LacI family DNA-binding transcriptional regulator [Clostridia bacterium]